MTDPKTRNLIRQGLLAAENGKTQVARRVFNEVLEIAPNEPDALAGLASVTADSAKRDQLLDQALTLDPENRIAQNLLNKLNGVVEEEIVAEKVVEEAIPEEILPDSGVCKNHADRDSSLKCIRCDEFICIDCAVKTPVGYTCPQCIRENEDKYFDATPLDYIISAVVALPVSLIAAYFLSGFGFWLIFIGGFVGTVIARVAQSLSRRRRGRYIPHVVAGCIIVAALLIWLIGGSLFGSGIFALVAAPAAFYQLR